MQHLLQLRTLQGREGEPAVGLAVSVIGIVNRDAWAAFASSPLEEVGFVGVRDLGGDALQQPPAETVQGRLRLVHASRGRR